MTVIAMTREMGSLGKDIALGLAEKLGLEIIHHELVERDLAERLDVGESDVHRFLEGKASLFERWKIDRQRLSRFTAEEILELAGRDNVLIRGWGAAYLLRPIRHVLCVRVCAPRAFRVKVLMERLGTSDRAVAAREIERNDAAHTRTMQSFFGASWEDPLNYDIVLNTERLPVETCTEQVRQLAASALFRKTEESRAVLADKLVEARIQTVLDREFGISGERRGIEAEVIAGRVVLTGSTTSKAMRDTIEDALRGVDGVSEVENNLVHLDQIYAG